MPDLDFTALTQLVDQLGEAGVTASVDASELSLPGVWVTLDTIETRNVRHDLRLVLSLYLIVPNTDPLRALEQLAALHNVVRTVVTPDGPVVSQGVILPSAPTEPMPALRLPLFVPGNV